MHLPFFVAAVAAFAAVSTTALSAVETWAATAAPSPRPSRPQVSAAPPGTGDRVVATAAEPEASGSSRDDDDDDETTITIAAAAAAVVLVVAILTAARKLSPRWKGLRIAKARDPELEPWTPTPWPPTQPALEDLVVSARARAWLREDPVSPSGVGLLSPASPSSVGLLSLGWSSCTSDCTEPAEPDGGGDDAPSCAGVLSL